MPRQARLDAPGTLHHVIVRGIEQGRIVADRKDRENFVARIGEVATATGTTIYAWALLPNHVHLLVRSGRQGLPRFMRRLLTGYAVSYNRRHRRYGHVFQNRYKSIVCDEEAYFRELVRYIHLNPLRAKLVRDVAQLDRYPWCGHRGVLGRVTRAWQDREYVLSWFGSDEGKAIRAYRNYIKEGLPQGHRPELVGGGLLRSLGGWAEVRALRRRKERLLADERILGRGEFVERMLQEADERLRYPRVRDQRLQEAKASILEACQRERISPEELRMGSRRRRISELRSRLAVRLVGRFGLSLADVARHLGVSTSGISKALSKTTRR